MSYLALLAEGPSIRELASGDAAAYAGPGFLWEHVEQADGPDALPSGMAQGVPEVVLGALVASETRPRCDQFEDGALLNLRGLGREPSPDGGPLVALRVWVRGNRVISVSRRGLAATPAVAAEMRNGRINDAGDLVAAFARAISSELDPEVASLGDRIDDCESAFETGNVYQLRRSIAEIRSEAIAHRRFVAPNRDALIALANLEVTWLSENDRLHIREAADRFARMVEELEAVREHAALLHEQLTDRRSELIDQRSLMIAIVAFIFLPLTFITGLLGMNVEGIPFADKPWAFGGVVVFCILAGLLVLGWFVRRHWLRR